MTSIHTGTITFLFTDIEGSTQLWAGRAMTIEQAMQFALETSA
jgi:class 3 adenylate cyclase